MRWTHLIRFSPDHTGYAVHKDRAGNMPRRLEAVGDNVHAPGQIVAVWTDKGPTDWVTKSGDTLEVLTRPSKGQQATQPKPHRVTVWIPEYEDAEPGEEPRVALCIPWVTSVGEITGPGQFRPTCDDLTRRIDARSHQREG